MCKISKLDLFHLCHCLFQKELPISVSNEDDSKSTIPQFVFKVNYTKKLDQSWLKRVVDKGVFYAFHGSSISNFYSILRFGLQTHFSVSKVIIK